MQHIGRSHFITQGVLAYTWHQWSANVIASFRLTHFYTQCPCCVNSKCTCTALSAHRCVGLNMEFVLAH